MSKGAEAKVTFRAFNQDYKKKIDENVAAGRTLKQDLRLTQEQLKTTGTDVDKLSATLDSLEKQYDLQKKTTEETRNQLELVKKQFGENSVEAQKMEKSLKSAEIAEQQLANRIDATKNSLIQAESAQDGYISKVNKLEQEQKELEVASERLASEYKLLQETTLKNASDSEKFAAAQKYVADQSELAERKIDSMERQLSETRKEFGENSREAMELETKLNQTKTSFSQLANEASQTSNDLSDAGKGFENLGDKIDNSNLMQAAEHLSAIGEKLKEIAGMAFEAALTMDEAASQYNKNFGLTGAEAEKTKDKIANLYKTGLVESYEEASEALIQTRDQLRGINYESLDGITQKALSFSKAFDSDMTETLRGANALIATYGMTADEAFDLMTVGAQRGLNKTDELGDNLAEYAVQFKQSGYSAAEMFEILDGGLSGGAYNLDKVNDLVKEMGIRVSDGSIQKAVEELGGEWQTLYENMSNNGASSNEIFDALASKISEVGDKTEKATLVSTIFGSLGEDNAVQVMEAMTSLSMEMTGIKGSYDEVTGAADRLNDASKSQEIIAGMNQLKDALRPIGEMLLDLALLVLPPLVSGLDFLVNNFMKLDKSTRLGILTFGALIVAFVTLMPLIAALVVSIGVLSSPWTLIVIAIMAVIAILVYLYSKFEWFRDGFHAFIDFFKNLVVMGFQFAANYIGAQFDAIIQNFVNFYEAGKRILNGFIDFFTGVFTGDWELAWQGLSDIVFGIFDGIAAMIKAPLNAMIGHFNGLISNANSIKIPDWVPVIGGNSFNIPQLPLLAKGGSFINGAAITGEAGPELVTSINGRTKVTPLNSQEKSGGVLGALLSLINNQGGMSPMLQGLQSAVATRLSGSEPRNDYSRLEYLLETLIEVVEAKELNIDLPGNASNGRTGFDRLDKLNKDMSAAEAIRKLGLR